MYTILRELLPEHLARYITSFAITAADCSFYKKNYRCLLRQIDDEYDCDFEMCQNANYIEFLTHVRPPGFVRMAPFHSDMMDLAAAHDWAMLEDTVQLWNDFFSVEYKILHVKHLMTPIDMHKFIEYRKKNHAVVWYVPRLRF
jgi:hypothetical protein